MSGLDAPVLDRPAGTDTDIDTSILEKLDFEIPCECMAWGQPCDNAAEWIATYNCCGQQMMICEWHRLDLRAFISDYTAQGGRVMHVPCNGEVTDIACTPLKPRD